MRIVIALAGNALLRRSDPVTAEVQRRNIVVAARAIAPMAAEHSVVIVHGNGPQVGLLSLRADAYTEAGPYPLDVLDAGIQGMIGYMIQQALRSFSPPRTSEQRRLDQVTPAELARYQLAAASMAPKAEAAVRFTRRTGNRAVIGSLDDIKAIVAGKAGTNVVTSLMPGPGRERGSEAWR